MGWDEPFPARHNKKHQKEYAMAAGETERVSQHFEFRDGLDVSSPHLLDGVQRRVQAGAALAKHKLRNPDGRPALRKKKKKAHHRLLCLALFP